jgi:SH3-like domain-containing protein
MRSTLARILAVSSLAALAALALAGPSDAQSDDGAVPAAYPTEGDSEAVTDQSAAAPGRGPETNLPLPRFVSLKTSEGNARRGPSLSHRIDWVFTHRDMPLLVTAEFGHWRRVEDSEGQGGWVHYTLLSGVRTVVVEKAMADLHTSPDPQSDVLARAEAGVIARLGDCSIDWCRITADGEDGWVQKSDIWGVGATETRE